MIAAMRLKSLLRRQGVRFLFIGGFAAAVNWLARFPLSAIMPFEAAVLAAYAIGMVTGFVLYRRYVFPGSRRPTHHQVLIFIAVNLAGAVIVLAAASFLLVIQDGLPYPQQWKEALAHGLAIGLAAFANFAGHKLLTFSKPRD